MINLYSVSRRRIFRFITGTISDYIHHLEKASPSSKYEIVCWRKTLVEIEGGALSDIKWPVAIDFFVSTVVAILFAVLINAAAIVMLVGQDVSPALKLGSGIVGGYELLTLTTPLAGWSGVFRLVYMSLVRIIPYAFSSSPVNMRSKVAKILPAFFMLPLNGGYLLTPIVSIMCLATERLPHFNLNPFIWRVRRFYRGTLSSNAS